LLLATKAAQKFRDIDSAEKVNVGPMEFCFQPCKERPKSSKSRG